MDGALLIKVDMVQSVALAVATYWLGSVIKNRVGILQKFSGNHQIPFLSV